VFWHEFNEVQSKVIGCRGVHPNPYAYGRYDYGPPPSITSMYAPRDSGSMYPPRDGSESYFASHPSTVAFMQQRDNGHSHGHHHPATAVPPHLSAAYQMGDITLPHPAVPRATATAFRQHTSMSSGLGRTLSHPIPEKYSNNQTSSERLSFPATSATSGNPDSGSIKRNRITSNDNRSAAFVELVVPDQPANAIALLPPLTETSAFRHISKNHEEVTAQRRRRQKSQKMVSGKPVLASSENGILASQPPVSLVDNDSDLYHLRQVAPCSCKWTRSSYEQVLAQADALVLSTIFQGKSVPTTQETSSSQPTPAAFLATCFATPADDSAVSFALKLEQQERAPEVVAEFISATLTLLKHELSSLKSAITGYSKSTENFHQKFENDLNQASNLLSTQTPIPEEYFVRMQPEANASGGEATGREQKKVFWDVFHQKMSDIVVAKNSLDVVVDGTIERASLIISMDANAKRVFSQFFQA
jgi:hypothetical protein